MAGARSECSTWRVNPRPSGPSSEPLPTDVFETVVNALVGALVADYKEDENDTVMSPEPDAQMWAHAGPRTEPTVRPGTPISWPTQVGDRK